MNVFDYLKEVKNKNISIIETISNITKEAKKLNKEYNYFNTITENFALSQAEKIEKNPKGKLAGLPVSVKDCICVKDIESRAGSKILKGYIPPFNATVINKILKEGAIIIGKTSQDEFGFGSFSVNTDNIPKNPYDKSRSCGGSSGGAAGFTAITKFPHISIAESTGGSIANPASFCGVSGLTPTYGLVSRYGLIDYANSLDKIGTIAKTPEEAKLLLDVISGYDQKDSTSLNLKINKDSKVKKIAVIKESLDVDKEIKDVVLSKLKNYDLISLKLVKKLAIPTYYLIAMSESSTNLAKYSGLRYGIHEKLEGDFNDYFTKTRSNNFLAESKRRIILGTFARMSGFRDAFYLKAMKIRTLIINEYKKAFSKYDILISPTMPIIAPNFFEIKKLTPLQNYMMDILTVGPNLAGFPHLSIPVGKIKKMPVGLMLITNHLNENKLISFSEKLKTKSI